MCKMQLESVSGFQVSVNLGYPEGRSCVTTATAFSSETIYYSKRATTSKPPMVLSRYAAHPGPVIAI